MLNPHHVRVWELPFELVGSDVVKSDATLNFVINMAPTDLAFRDQTNIGNNVNGLAYAALLIGGGGIAGFGLGRLRVAHITLWLGFALLSLLSVYAIPFFVVVAVPIIAAQFNAFSGRVTLGTKTEQRTRLLLLGSGGGRILCLIAVVVGGVLTWPGWMQPSGLDGGIPRRVGWSIETDESLVRTATQLQQWRTSGALPTDAHGLIASVNLADYCAWFAPDEKVFINSRLSFHRPELPDFVEVRGAGGIIRRDDAPPNQMAVAQVMRNRSAVYLAMYNSRGRTARVAGHREGDEGQTIWDVFNWDDWATWYFDGRTLLLGWRPGVVKAGLATPRRFEVDPSVWYFDGRTFLLGWRRGVLEAGRPSPGYFELDPAVAAFGPGVSRLRPGTVTAPPGVRSWMDEFVNPLRAVSADVDEALGWVDYKNALRNRSTQVSVTAMYLRMNVPAPSTLPLVGLPGVLQTEFLARNNRFVPSPLPDGSFEAIPILATRAARRAIAANPDHPDGYFALSLAVADPDLPITDSERIVWRITALRQCLDRMPPPDQWKRGVFVASPTIVAQQLAFLYLGPQPNGQFAGIPLDLRPQPEVMAGLLGLFRETPQGQIATRRFIPFDLALQSLQLAIDYGKYEVIPSPDGSKNPFLQQLTEMHKAIDREVRARFDSYQSVRELATTPADRYVMALKSDLVGEAIRLFEESLQGEESKRPTPEQALPIAAAALCVGKLEWASQLLEGIRDRLETSPESEQKLRALRSVLQLLDYHQAVLSGDYARAGTDLESLQGPRVSLRPKFPAPSEFLGILAPIWNLPPAGPGSFNFLVPPELMRYHAVQEVIGDQLDQEAKFFFLRGFLSLVEGDIEAAKVRFNDSKRVVPEGWTKEKAHVVNPRALMYLDIIANAEKRASEK
jgi:hypothetical protein